MYEALRDDGASKEKAARIANASAARGRSAVGRKGGHAEPYEEWTVADLRRRAAELGSTDAPRCARPSSFEPFVSTSHDDTDSLPEPPTSPAHPETMRSTAALFALLLGGIVLGLIVMLIVALAGR